MTYTKFFIVNKIKHLMTKVNVLMQIKSHHVNRKLS